MANWNSNPVPCMTCNGAKCHVLLRNCQNLRSKTEPGEAASCYRCYFLSLSLKLFMLFWMEDISAFNGVCHWFSNTSTMMMTFVRVRSKQILAQRAKCAKKLGPGRKLYGPTTTPFSHWSFDCEPPRKFRTWENSLLSNPHSSSVYILTEYRP